MIKFAIIGAGGIAVQHAEALSKLENTIIEAVIDTDQEKAKAMAAKYGGQAYKSLEDCYKKVDAVSILTPPSTHRQLCLNAIALDKPIICEKPLSISVEDAQAIADGAEQKNSLFMTAFNMRFRKSYRRLKDTISSGTIGDPINYWCQRLGLGAGGTGGWKGYNWRTDPSLLCGMTIESLSHDIDMIRWMAGEIESVKAYTNESITELPGFDDNANVVMKLKNGAIASIHASWSSHIGLNARGMIGSEGTAIVEGHSIWHTDRFRFKTADMEYEQMEMIEDKLDALSYLEEVRHFVSCVEKDQQPQTTARDGLMTVKISQAILSSAKTNETVMINAG